MPPRTLTGVRVFFTSDPFVKFTVTLATGERVYVWARTQAHANTLGRSLDEGNPDAHGNRAVEESH